MRPGSGEVHAVHPVPGAGAVRAVILLYEPGDRVQTAEEPDCKVRDPDAQFRGKHSGGLLYVPHQPGGGYHRV